MSVFQEPLGGSESAVSYLSIELAKLGHEITLYTTHPQAIAALGVRCQQMQIANGKINIHHSIVETQFDIIILKNGLLPLAKDLKKNLPYPTKILLWTGHAANQPAIADLEHNDIINSFDQIICVSKWHAQTMSEKFKLPHHKVHIQRNAISPFFENLFIDQTEFQRCKVQAQIPQLAYTSTPFRGLTQLLEMFPTLYQHNPQVKLNVFSSMQVYGIAQEHDQFKHLYAKAKELNNINYIGSLPQIQLASQMRPLTIFSYPNTFAETSCIAVMEALASGLYIVTTKLAALPETSLGYGTLIEPDNIASFPSALSKIITLLHQDPHAFYAARYQQVLDINTNHTWRIRARSWEHQLHKLLA